MSLHALNGAGQNGNGTQAVPPKRHRYAFILPRFGAELVGGAENLVGALAERLVARGDDARIFTTCAKDNRSWKNEYTPGETIERGVPIFRFPVDQRNLDLWIPHQIHISEGLNLGVEDQLEWMEHSVNSRELYEHVARCANSFDALFFAPYLFGTTFWGSLLRPEKSYLIPCLHNENYAYLDIIASMFRQVKGALFNSEPEKVLAKRLYGEVAGGEVGMGFIPYSDEEVATLTPYFQEHFPYVLYLGRKETGKNAQLLIDNFIALKEAKAELQSLKLVIAGGGSFADLERPGALERKDIIDITHVSEGEKQRLLKYALCLCQPSINESFSIVLMEAWLLGTPVLVNANCEVTKHHVVKSGGGLYFNTESEFVEVITSLYKESTFGVTLGEAGRRYVMDQYNWDAVLHRFDDVMAELL